MNTQRVFCFVLQTVSLGLFTENGPMKFDENGNLTVNYFGWNRVSTMLYLEDRNIFVCLGKTQYLTWYRQVKNNFKEVVTQEQLRF